MRALAHLARQNKDALANQVCRYAQVAIAHPTSYVDTMPAELPWKSALSQLQQTQVSTLDNGLRVATQVVPHSDISTVGVYIDAGSRYETEENNGVAHFLEHLMFKGTKKRGIQDIETQVENMGASVNAYTSRENTAFYARCIGRDVSNAMDILGDMVMNSKLDSASVARERDVILREAKEIDGMVEEVVLDHLHATAFQHTPLGRTILGSAQNIQSMTKEDVEAYIRAHYTAGRMVVVAAGDVNHNDVVNTASKIFSGLPADSTTAASLVAAEPSYFTGSSVSVREPDMSTTGFAVAFKGASHLDPDSVTLSVMANMLGAWSKDKGTAFHQRSRIATAVAQNGLADSVMGFNTPYHDTGLFGVYTQTSNPEALEDLSWVIMQEMTRLAYEVDEADVQLARTATKANHLALLSHSTGICEDVAKQLLMFGRLMPREEYFARVDAVTTDVVRDCASRRIQDQDMAVSAVGELSFLPHYNWFRRRSYWNRY